MVTKYCFNTCGIYNFPELFQCLNDKFIEYNFVFLVSEISIHTVLSFDALKTGPLLALTYVFLITVPI